MKIFDSRKSIVLASIGVLFASLALVSCEKREEPLLNEMSKYSKNIVFTEQAVQTRASYVDYTTAKPSTEYVFRSEETTDSLFLSEYVTDLAIEQLMTRAEETTTANLGQFRILAYNVGADEDLSINRNLSKLVGKKSDGKWSYGAVDEQNDINWSELGSDNVQFYAYANLPTAEGAVSNTGLPETQFRLTLPTSAENQTDIIVAKAEKNYNSSSNELVPLNFKHICAGIRFVKGSREVVGTIESISLVNCISSGVYDVTSQTWDRNNFGDPVSTITVGSIENNTSAEVGTQIGHTLMIVPQTIDADNDTYINVTFRVASPSDEGDNGLRTIPVRFPAGYSWEAGKMYTYKISNTETNYLEFIGQDRPIDAHYVIDNVEVDVVSGDVTEFTVTAYEENGKTLATDIEMKATQLNDYELRGYWIDNEDLKACDGEIDGLNLYPRNYGSCTVKNPSVGPYTIHLFFPENATSKERKIVLKLTGKTRQDGDIEKVRTLLLTQYCPTSIGCERIEEDQKLPWGPYWDSDLGSVKYTIPSESKNGWEWFVLELQAWFCNYVPDLAESWGWNQDGISYETSGFILSFDLKAITINYSEFMGYSTSESNGLENTKGIYFGDATTTNMSAIVELQNTLDALGATPNKDVDLDSEGIEGSALLQALKKNKYSVEIVSASGKKNINLYLKNGTNNEGGDDNVKWYLPAIDELPSQLNSMNGLAGTAPSGIYWSSTASDGDNSNSHSRAYDYDNNNGNINTIRTNADYNLRAVRVVDWN